MAEYSVGGIGGSGSRILDAKTCDEAIRTIREMSEYAQEFFDSYENGLKAFNSNSIVQSFYASGNYGKYNQERIEKVMSALSKYMETISNGPGSLCDETRKFLEKQESLLNSGVSSTSYESAATNRTNMVI